MTQIPEVESLRIPRIDVSSLLAGDDDGSVAAAIDDACRNIGFFTIIGHGIPAGLRDRLEACARDFFTLDDHEKSRIAMRHGGRAWRGWFPLGDELTSGRADLKEGIYFGVDLPTDDPRVRAGVPLHGPNLWPDRPAEMRPIVSAWMREMRRVASGVMRGIATGLGLPPSWFEEGLTADPTELFRIFHYPATSPSRVPAPERISIRDTGNPTVAWGVGEHTDYGLLTLLTQDDVAGLQVHTRDGWIDVPADPDALVCNIGDMLDRMTQGRYRSTPHRVIASGCTGRLSFPYFFDPGWDTEVQPLPLSGEPAPDDADRRWDGTSLRTLKGNYGEYLLNKVAHVFPELFRDVRSDQEGP